MVREVQTEQQQKNPQKVLVLQQLGFFPFPKASDKSVLSVALPSCCCCFTHGTRKLFQYLETHSPHFFFFFLVCAYTLVHCHNPTDKRVALPRGLGRQAVSPTEQRRGAPHLRSQGWDTQQVTSRQAPISRMSPGQLQTYCADHFVTALLCGSTKAAQCPST